MCGKLQCKIDPQNWIFRENKWWKNWNSRVTNFNFLQQQTIDHDHHRSVYNQQAASSRQHTITIQDTPSPSVSVITISDSEEEIPSGKKGSNRHSQTISNRQLNMQQQQHQSNSHSHRKNVISCVSVGDSDNEERGSIKVSLMWFYVHSNSFWICTNSFWLWCFLFEFYFEKW